MSDQLGGDPKAKITWSEERTRPGTAVHCPHCGIQVAPGYPKCPKCHAALPTQAPPPPRATSAGGMPGPGGTSAVGGPIGGRTLWLAVAAGAVALVVAVVLVVRASGDELVAVAADAGDELAADDEDELVAGDEADDEGFTEEDAGPDTSGAAGALLGELRARRLWSNVEAEGRTIVIQSAFCDDPELTEAIDELRATLTAGGAQKVECYARHGGLELERPLQ